jgi:hypothetical protein
VNENPYAPPKARLEDAEPEGDLTRPQSVVLGVRILWASFGVGVLSSIYDVFEAASGIANVANTVGTVVSLGVGFAISYLLNTAAWRGRGWSRVVQAVLLAIAIPIIVFAYQLVPQAFVFSWFVIATSAIQQLLNLAGLGLLFAPSANAWYRAMKRARAG